MSSINANGHDNNNRASDSRIPAANGYSAKATAITQKDLIDLPSELMKEVRNDVEHFAPVKTLPVLITGENGTGKEGIAQLLHKQSGCEGYFVPVNCAALSPTLMQSELFGHEKGGFTGADKTRVGRFELARNGTLFLDEITEIPLASQAMLLRVLEEGQIERVGSNDPIKVTARIVSATNRDPEKAIREGILRRDLYERLCGFEVNLPPLRQRREDIVPLAEHFASKSPQLGKGFREPVLSEAAKDALKQYNWPGNIRELKYKIFKAAVKAQYTPDVTITPEMLDLKKSVAFASAHNCDLGTLVTHGHAITIQQAANECGVSNRTMGNFLLAKNSPSTAEKVGFHIYETQGEEKALAMFKVLLNRMSKQKEETSKVRIALP